MYAAARFQRALAALPKKTLSLADAADAGTRRQMADVLETIGLRFRERRGVLVVEPNGDSDAAQRVAGLVALGVDVANVADTMNGHRAVTLSMPVDLVPVPLSTALWSDAIFQRRVPPAELLAAILADDRAALLCHGLAGLDDLTLQYLAERPGILRSVVRGALGLRGVRQPPEDSGRPVVTPGEDVQAQARTVWEPLVEARTGEPARFISSLFTRRAGRLAYVYDTVAELDPPRIAFTLGLSIKRIPSSDTSRPARSCRPLLTPIPSGPRRGVHSSGRCTTSPHSSPLSRSTKTAARAIQPRDASGNERSKARTCPMIPRVSSATASRADRSLRPSSHRPSRWAMSACADNG